MTLRKETHFFKRSTKPKKWVKSEDSSPPMDAYMRATLIEEGDNCLVLLDFKPTRTKKWLDAQTFKGNWRGPRREPQLNVRVHEGNERTTAHNFGMGDVRQVGGSLVCEFPQDASTQLSRPIKHPWTMYLRNLPIMVAGVERQLHVRAPGGSGSPSKLIQTRLREVSQILIVAGLVERPARDPANVKAGPEGESSDPTAEILKSSSVDGESTVAETASANWPWVESASRRLGRVFGVLTAPLRDPRKWLSTGYRATWVAAASVFLVVVPGIGYLVVRRGDYFTVGNPLNGVGEGEVILPDTGLQKVLFLLVLSAPILFFLIDAGLRKAINRDRSRSVTSSHYAQALVFSRVLVGAVLTLVIYILLPAAAWDEVSSRTHLWFWEDRQTVALLATVLIGVMSTIFSNSLKELATETTVVRAEIREKSERLRRVLNDVTEETHRLWSEYESMFQDVGKTFLYRANEFAHLSSKEGASLAGILRGLFLISESDNKWNESSDTSWATNFMAGRPSSAGLDWTDVNDLDENDFGESPLWTDYFRVSDISHVIDGLGAPADHTLRKLEHRLLTTDLMNSSLSPATADDSTGDDTDISIPERLLAVVRKFVDTDDGRFCNINVLMHPTKRSLTLYRWLNSIMTELKMPNGTTRTVFGYFPTDEELTLSFMDAMSDSLEWLTSESGRGMNAWFIEVYSELQQFGIANRQRFDRLEKLEQEVKLLLDGLGIPSDLVLDDIHLLKEILQTGTDSQMRVGHHSLDDQQRATLARALTYASAFYVLQVWHRGYDRALPPTFPNPFAVFRGQVKRESDAGLAVRSHPTDFIDLLRETVDRSLATSTDRPRRPNDTDSTNDDDPWWPPVIELSNRKGPSTNLLRAARAFSSRREFLDNPAVEPKSAGFIDESPDRRFELLRVLFCESGSNRAENLLLSVTAETDDIGLRGPVSMKVARKSSIRSFYLRRK